MGGYANPPIYSKVHAVGEVLRRKAQRKVSTRAFPLHAICIPNLAGSQCISNCKIYYNTDYLRMSIFRSVEVSFARSW